MKYNNINIVTDKDLILNTLYVNNELYYEGIYSFWLARNLAYFTNYRISDKNYDSIDFYYDYLKKNGYKKFYKFYDKNKNMINISFIESVESKNDFKTTFEFLTNMKLKNNKYHCDEIDICKQIMTYKSMKLINKIFLDVPNKNKLKSSYAIFIGGITILIETEVNKKSTTYKEYMKNLTKILNQIEYFYKPYDF
jgi:hypothetical protein